MDIASDSLFTLTLPQITAVVLIGLALSTVWIAALLALLSRVRGVKGTAVWAPILCALGFAFLFEWVSPQIYYLYYRTIFDGLPSQWVIGWPPSPLSIFRLMMITPVANLSELARAILYWVLVVVALSAGARSPSRGRRP